VFSTYLNGSVSTQGTEASSVNALAADATGNVYAAGQDSYSVKEGFPATAGVLQPTCLVATNSGECDTGFVTKLNPLGALVWSTFYGSPSSASGNQTVSAIALDSSDNVYITANAGQGDYPMKNSLSTFTGGSVYMSVLSSDATKVLFGTYYGINTVFTTSIAVDASQNVYLAGYTSGTFPLVNALQSSNGGGYNEGIFARITNTLPQPASFVSPASGASGAAAAGAIEAVYATDLANGTASETGLPLPVTLAGSTINIVDSSGVSTPAPLFFVSPAQANFLIPSGVALGTASITVNSGDGTTSVGTLKIATVAPGLFLLNPAGLVAADVLTFTTAGGSISGNVFQLLNGAIVALPVSLGPPAQQVFLVLYGTGISGRSSLANVSVSMGGLSLPVLYAGPTTDEGLDQVNVLIPASLAESGNTAVTITVDGMTSNTAYVTIM
jgi:uncharacterized protein (TIGR03437 family)